MPPWPSRGQSNPKSSSKPVQKAPSTPSRFTDDSVNSSSPFSNLEIPTLHSSRPRPETSHSALSHSRSFSHPFPSFLKRSDKKHVSKQESLALDSTDDEGSYSRGPTSQRVAIHTAPKTVEKEPVTGKCMTCDSTVRWPQGLKVFRCTICLAINDLEPLLEGRVGDSAPGSRPSFSVPRRLSIDRTRNMINRCIDDFLQRQLRGIDTLQKSQKSPPTLGHVDDEVINDFFIEPSRDRADTSHENSASLHRATSSPFISPRPHFKTRSPSDSRLSSRRPSYQDLRYSEFEPAQSTIQKTKPGLERRPSQGNSLEVPDYRTEEWQGYAGSDTEVPKRARRGHDGAIFRPVENYIAECFAGCAALNASFLTVRPPVTKAASEGSQTIPMISRRESDRETSNAPLSELDAKTLLLGDFAENGSWWTGSRPDNKMTRKERTRERSPDIRKGLVTLRSPRIQWHELAAWYELVINAGNDWRQRWLDIRPVGEDEESVRNLQKWTAIRIETLERDFLWARTHAQRALLKITENLLKRPKRPLKHAEDCRFLLMLLANPLLLPSTPAASPSQLSKPATSTPTPSSILASSENVSVSQHASQQSGLVMSGGPGHHAGLLKRIFGLLANVPNEIHHFLVAWFSRLPDQHFQDLVDLVGSFVTYRLSRQQRKTRSEAPNPTEGLVPSFSNLPATNSSAQFHAALGGRPTTSSRRGENKPNPATYGEDWQVRAAARVMALLFAANSGHPSKKRDTVPTDQGIQSAGLNAKHAAHAHGQIIPISNFYNTLLDYSDLVADFEAWESNRGKFSFCQYPFFLSIWAKIHIMEHDARRQMEVRAREAFFDSILSRKAVSQYLVLKVRRDCLVEDSLQSVSEVIGSGVEEIKKGLRIDFVGEEGVDAGGLRKEWFLLLVREIFDPHHGLFVYDEESQFCYFNPYCFESSEQFFLVGVLLGLAIYNSTILDVALPPFAFKKLLASAPTASVPATTAPRLVHGYTLEDLAEFRPALARGLRSLLEFEGDVEETICRNFVAEVDRYGEVIEIPLCPGGETKPVTNNNRREFVDLYVVFLLETQVSRQYEPFKRGFFTVCGGNALSLFRPEEIELLVRGSDEPLDIDSLRAVATYEGWHTSRPENEPCVQWFWDCFASAAPKNQRRILSFITGSDRIPAMGATNLGIKVACLGEVDSDRLPMARTCFNMVGLYRYSSEAKLREKLWMAVSGSEGFGLK